MTRSFGTIPVGLLPARTLALAASLVLVAGVSAAQAGEAAPPRVAEPVALFQQAVMQEHRSAYRSSEPQLQRMETAQQAADRRSAEIRRIQASLTQLGFDPGPLDGKLGPQTRSAIRAFEQERQQAPSGRASPALLRDLSGALAEARQSRRPATVAKAPAAVEPIVTAAEEPSKPRVRLISSAEAAEPVPAARVAPAGPQDYGLRDAIAESWSIVSSLSGAMFDLVQAQALDATR
ncbi:MAG: peptidoglycan-binding domain-containing protein [Tistlia sp.]|uniref:peptidoglycan-binding protein n=1 Tax=Tistlia sp. TaxID=3057121 RepID=UPI0034A2827D